jgi:hypothetical protein
MMRLWAILVGAAGRRQISEFLKPDGVFIDVCGPDPCYLAGWTGP